MLFYFLCFASKKIVVFRYCTAQKMKFSIKDFFSKCDQIAVSCGFWSHLLKKSLMENFIFSSMLPWIWSLFNFFTFPSNSFHNFFLLFSLVLRFLGFFMNSYKLKFIFSTYIFGCIVLASVSRRWSVCVLVF